MFIANVISVKVEVVSIAMKLKHVNITNNYYKHDVLDVEKQKD